MLSLEEQLLEKLAKLEHEQWAHWTLYFLKKHVCLTETMCCITTRQLEHWLKQVHTPYEKLSEEEKEKMTSYKNCPTFKRIGKKAGRSTNNKCKEASNNRLCRRCPLYSEPPALPAKYQCSECGLSISLEAVVEQGVTHCPKCGTAL